MFVHLIRAMVCSNIMHTAVVVHTNLFPFVEIFILKISAIDESIAIVFCFTIFVINDMNSMLFD